MIPYSIPLWTIFTKWPGAGRAAVQVAELGGRRVAACARGCARPAEAGRERP